MNDPIERGPVPRDLGPHLTARDRRPFPDEALLKFQQISRGRSARANLRMLLFEDGRLFVDRHNGDERDWSSPFDRPPADVPDKTTNSEIVAAVRTHLEDASFLDQAPYQIDRGVRGGDNYVVTARLDGAVHEVIYAAVYPPFIDFFLAIASLAPEEE